MSLVQIARVSDERYAVQPSLSVCASECGAKCCRTPTMKLGLRTPEVKRLKAAAAALGVKVKVLHMRRDDRGDLWVLDLARQGTEDGACPLLDRETNTCRAWADRPDACRKFPHRPFRGCLVWPGVKDSPEVGGHVQEYLA